MNRFVLASLMGIIAFGAGCSDDDTIQPPPQQNDNMKMYMVDAPSAFDAVTIVITKVEVRRSPADTAWVTLNNSTQSYNVLSLRNGRVALIGNGNIAAGAYAQMRLTFGSNCTVVVDGAPVTLALAGSTQGGLVIEHTMNVTANATYEVTLDFNVNQSIREVGPAYILDPVFRVQDNDSAGTVSGRVQPATAHVTVWAVVGGDTVSTVADTVQGNFQLMAVQRGTYDVNFTPAVTTSRDTTVVDVVVSARQITNVGTIVLP
jgi:hypothetical protein